MIKKPVLTVEFNLFERCRDAKNVLPSVSAKINGNASQADAVYMLAVGTLEVLARHGNAPLELYCSLLMRIDAELRAGGKGVTRVDMSAIREAMPHKETED